MLFSVLLWATKLALISLFKVKIFYFYGRTSYPRIAVEMKKDTPSKELLAQKAAKRFLPYIQKYYRAKYYGLDHVPKTPFLAVGNHLGVYFMPESFLWIGKYQLLQDKPPMKVLVHQVMHRMLQSVRFPEDEFGIIEAKPSAALKALKEGYAVTVYPGGDKDNTRSFRNRNKIDFFDHTGYIKLAIQAGVPILPVVGIGGGETLFVLSSGQRFAKRNRVMRKMKVNSWPIYWSFPFGLHVGHGPNISVPLPSQMTMVVLPPYALDHYSIEDAKDPVLVENINQDILRLMQTEMDKYTKGRIPVLGQMSRRR